MLNDPDHFEEHIHRYSISVARSIAYGRRVPVSGDPFAKDISTLMQNFSMAMTPGRYLVESLPMLRHLPLMFQPWMKELQPIRDHEESSNLKNFKQALDDSEKHPDRVCVALDIHKARGPGDRFHALQSATTCNEILGTGSETTANSLLFTIQACIAFPEVVKKAHEELDRVIGRHRMPTWEDEPNLPYIRAMVKEQHRWRTIAPTGILLSLRTCSTEANKLSFSPLRYSRR
jgi:Cytochrome P450